MKSTFACDAVALVGLILWSAVGLRAEPFTPEQVKYFEDHIRPILVEHCYKCHSGQAHKLRAGLRLDSRESMLRGGDSGPAISPGHAEDSLLIEAVQYQSLQMPPRGKLSAADIQHLVEWVNLNAPWPATDESKGRLGLASPQRPFDGRERMRQHWAFQPLVRVQPPCPDNDWASSPLDQFISQRLEQAGLVPADDAEPRALVRRLYLDLVGLPPTPAQVGEFLADPSAERYAQLVDQLLASPRFGEKWARHWMDLVRYAETYGHEYDYAIEHAYQYRDYLIRALNADVPYRQLIMEHVAGDLLNPPRLNPETGTNESIIGTGFWLFGEAFHGPTDVMEDEATRIDNQIDVFGKTFLGLSLACARCHDHKFDPVSMEDYYALKGVLQSSRYQVAQLIPQSHQATYHTAVQAWREQANRMVHEAVTHAKLQAEDVTRFLLAQGSEVSGPETRDFPLNLWCAVKQAMSPVGEDHLNGDSAAQGPDKHELSFPATFQLAMTQLKEEGKRATSLGRDVEWITPIGPRAQDTGADGDGLRAYRVLPSDACQYGARAGVTGCFGFAAGHLYPPVDSVLRSRTFKLKNGFVQLHLRAKNATARLICHNYQLEPRNSLLFENTRLSGEALGDGNSYRWVRLGHALRAGNDAYLEFTLAEDGFLICDLAYVDEGNVEAPTTHPVSFSLAEFESPAPQSLQELADKFGSYWLHCRQAWQEGRVDAPQARFVDWLFAQGLLPTPKGWTELRARIDDATRLLPRPIEVLAVIDGSGLDAHVAIRGNTHNPGSLVPRRWPMVMGDEPSSPIVSGSGRLELAHRLIDSPQDHPLVARVFVNRIWAQLFGQGLVPTVDDFGAMGQPPSHPELLDWLAVDFIQYDWSLKHVIRQIVTSHTYRMSTRPHDAAARQHDPQNRLLHCMTTRRLSYEQLRDQILTVAGSLNDTMGGPSVPVFLSDFMQGRGRPEQQGRLDGEGRRSIYLSVRRNFLSQDSLAFDFPLPTTTAGRRVTSNVPAQSLVLINSPFVADQAQSWARRVCAEHADSAARIQAMFLSGLSRPATDRELQRCQEFLSRQIHDYQSVGPPRARAVVETGSQSLADKRPTDADDDPNEPQAVELLAWADLCQVMFNLKEFIYVP